MNTNNRWLVVLLPLTAVAGCAGTPSAPSTASSAAKPEPLVCRQIIQSRYSDNDPIYCGTREQVVAVQGSPELLDSAVCQKIPLQRTRLSPVPDAPVCMLPEHWKRADLVFHNSLWNRNYSTLTQAAHEMAIRTQPPIPGVDFLVPPGQGQGLQ